MFEREDNQQKNQIESFDLKLPPDEEHSLFSIITDFLDSLIVILDQEGKIKYYNKACENIIGISHDQVREQYYWDIFCLSEERELYKYFFMMLEPENYPMEVETQLKSKNEDYYTILWKYNALKIKDGAIQLHLLSGTDLTSQIKDKKDLQELGEKYRTILHASPVSVISTDLNYNIKSWSSAAESLLGWHEKEVIGKNLFSFLYDSDSVLYQCCDKALQGKIKKDLELKTYCRDKTKLYVNISMAPIRDYKGIIDGLVIVIFDITSKKEAEEKIRYLSFHDSLTGLYNRRFLEEEMSRLETDRQMPMGIIMVDLNGLKLVNDTYGHNAGDELLKKAADILNITCRKEDLIARWGGDEFVILLPNITEKNLEKICTRIKENSKDKYVVNIPISFALGTAIKDRVEKSLDVTLQEAENDMYAKKFQESKNIKIELVNSLIKDTRSKSFETIEHIMGMEEIAVKIGDYIGLTHFEVDRLKHLIQLHDIGKINIQENILTKSKPLSAEEWKEMKKHPEIGYRIARASEEYAHVAEDILSHHEHWDGRGYPRGLKEDNIPLLARIVAIADAYEVMKTGRPYKEAMSYRAIVEEFKYCSGRQFDPELVKCMLKILGEE